ncbi:MAG TPA: hypothetical protein VHB51_02855 [Candidatus Saccharimonadales bacterium]|nr:hypothetical protein [Candidatus Saccharimonadales bacterium]
MSAHETVDHTARIVYVGTPHGLVREQYVHGVKWLLPESVFPNLEPKENETLGWIDFKCANQTDCGYTQTYGGNPHRLCGGTFLATDTENSYPVFRTSTELVNAPALITTHAAAWLRRVQRSDTSHPPFPRKRSDEIAAVMACLPLLKKVPPEVERYTDGMAETLATVIGRRNGEIRN